MLTIVQASILFLRHNIQEASILSLHPAFHTLNVATNTCLFTITSLGKEDYSTSA